MTAVLRRRPARGFTLLELVVVVTLASVLMAGLFQWLYTLNRAAATGRDTPSMQHLSQVAEDQFAADIGRARPCGAPGTRPLRDIEPDSVAFFMTVEGDLSLVTWSVTADGNLATLRRTLTAAPAGQTDPCAGWAPDPTDPTQTYSTVLAPVRIAAAKDTATPYARTAFRAVWQGQALPNGPNSWGACPSADDAARCAAGQIAIDWMSVPDDSAAAPAVARDTFTFPSWGGPLS